MQPISIRALLSEAAHQLTELVDEPMLEAQVLLSHVLKKPRTYFIASPETLLTENEVEIFFSFMQRRMQGEPIAYLLNERDFWSLTLEVTQATLIPRPETELMVELVLNHFGKDVVIKLADLGTGSGAIALAIAMERPNWSVTATDISESALQIAKQNAEKHGLTQLSFYQGDWCFALPHNQYDVIVSNPPYLSELEWPAYEKQLAYEPRSALVSGKDGLDAIRAIIQHIPHYLKQNGRLWLEHGCTQAMGVRELLLQSGFQSVQTYQDLAGLDRITGGIKA